MILGGDVSRKKILLADDADLILKLERAFLRRKNFHLLVARDAPDVMNILDRELPDLVFLDLALPGMGGDECCRRIKSDPRLSTIPVVILADGHDEDEMHRCRRAGCDQILTRPIGRHHLSALVRELLDLPSRQHPRFETSLQIAYGPERRQLYAGEALNLSTGGVLIETRHLLPVDTRVSMEILLPSASAPIRCSGRIAWLSEPAWIQNSRLPGEMGVQFLDLSPEDKDILQAYLEAEGERSDR